MDDAFRQAPRNPNHRSDDYLVQGWHLGTSIQQMDRIIRMRQGRVKVDLFGSPNNIQHNQFAFLPSKKRFGNGKKCGLGLGVGDRNKNPEIAERYRFVLLGKHQAHAGA